MNHSSATSATGLWRRAWTASLLFHLATTIALGVIVHQMPRGADLGEGTGIVIDLTRRAGSEWSAGPDLKGSTPDVIEPNRLLDTNDGIAISPAETLAANVNAQLPDWGPSAVDSSLTSVTQPQITPSEGGARSGGAATAVSNSTPGVAARLAGPEKPRGVPFEGIGGGSRSTVEVFGVKGSGSKFVYLFDRSSSMEGAPLAAAKRQLIQSLQALKSINQFQIIFFNLRPFPIDITGHGRMAFADDRNKRTAAGMVGSITAESGTDRYVALKTAIAFQPDVIFFLTDADDAMLQTEIAEIARVNERTAAMICVIEFGREKLPPQENFLMQLARESGGQYGYIDTTTLGR